MDQTLHRLAETFGIVNPSARQRTLPPPLRQLHQQILRHFAEHATAPEAARLREWADQLDIELDEALAQLVSVDLVEADPATARLLGAYPFSAIRRGHKVQLADGPTVEAYCAIDALGIPAMLNPRRGDQLPGLRHGRTDPRHRVQRAGQLASRQHRCGGWQRPQLRAIRLLPLPLHHLPQLVGEILTQPRLRIEHRRRGMVRVDAGWTVQTPGAARSVVAQAR